MVVAVFDNNSTTSEGSLIDSDHVLRYYEDRKHLVRELCVGQLWQDEHIGELAGIVRSSSSHHDCSSKDICLQRLSLRNNSLTERSGDSLANILNNVYTLRELDLSDNKVEAKGLKSLVGALRNDRSSLRSLNLFNNHLRSNCAKPIAEILENNTSLVCLNLGKNQLTSKGCMDKLAAAFCKNSYLQELDLSHNKMGNARATQLAAILDPECSQSRLQVLNLANNLLTKVGVDELIGAMIHGSNTQLVKLDLSMNALGHDDNQSPTETMGNPGEENEQADGIEACAILLQYSYTLQELMLSSCKVGDRGVGNLCNGILEQRYSETVLRVLDLGYNCIHDSGATKLASMLQANDTLEVLNLESNGIGDKGAQALASALLPNNQLQELNLRGNQIRDPGAFKLAEAVCQEGCTLVTLKWEDNYRITEKGQGRLEGAFRLREARATWLGRILKTIETRKNMRELRLKLGDEELIAICRHLGVHKPRLPYVHISSLGLSSRGIEVLAKTVISKNCIPLQRLYLQNAHIGDHGTAAISQALLHNQHMTILSLPSCDITDEGASFLANLLLRKTKLKRIDLSKNRIGDVGAQKLFHAICDDPVHPSMTALTLAQNLLTDFSVCTLSSFAPLTKVHLGKNMLTDRGALDLAKVCMSSPKLERLHVQENQMTKKGVQALNLFLPRHIVIFDSGNQQPPPSADQQSPACPSK